MPIRARVRSGSPDVLTVPLALTDASPVIWRGEADGVDQQLPWPGAARHCAAPSPRQPARRLPSSPRATGRRARVGDPSALPGDRFDLGRASRATYDDRVVRRRAADLARNARAAKRRPVATLSLEDLDSERDGGQMCAEPGCTDSADWEDTAALRCDLARFLAVQPPRLQECCLLLLTHSVAETARMLGHHRSSMYAWLATLRERGRAAGLAIYLSAGPTNSVPAE